MVGKTLGHYRILRQLGSGGMGDVYAAEDTKLHRRVALKVLPEELAARPERLARFEREARAVAAVDHPNIVTIYSVEHFDELHFITMQLIEGQTLSKTIPPRGLPLEEFFELAIPLVNAVAAAHQQGILHRDLKPANIMVSDDGRVKVLDFGLAKLRPESDDEGVTVARTEAFTDEGQIMGTTQYMAPEQLKGEEADDRSDIFSLGVVLYEMATGTHPFAGGTAADLISSILRDEPTSVTDLRSEFPQHLGWIIQRCLRKDRARRLQTALDLRNELEELKTGIEAAAPGPARSVAVLPFKDLAGDAENVHIGVGLADATITELASVKSLLVRPTACILRYQDRPSDPLQAGRELAVDAVVDGSFQRFGSRLRVTVQLISMADGRSLWGTKINTSFDDIFQLQDEVSRKITKALEVELTQEDERRLARTKRAAGEAYELYLRGRVQLLEEITVTSVNTAIEYFEGAREADPNFPLAYAGLSDAYARIAFTWEPEADWHAQAEEMCDRALALDPQLPEGRYLRGRLLWSPAGGFDHKNALREFVAAIAARPNLNEAYDWLAAVLFHIGLFEDSARQYSRALAINPDDMIAYMQFGFCRYLQGRYREALQMAEDTARRSPSGWPHYQIALCQLRLGHSEDARETAELASRTYPGGLLFYPIRGLVAALQGDAELAHQQVQLTVKNKKAFGHYHHAQYDVACIYALLAEGDEALEWLRRAANNGFPCHPFFERDPLLETVRGDERFVLLMDELRTECESYRKLYSELKQPGGGFGLGVTIQ